MKEFRIDVGGLLRKPRRDSRGFLRVDGHAAKVGVQVYSNGDGTTRRELRLPEDVFAPESLASYEGAQFTDHHPPEMLTPANAKRYAVGSVVGEGRRDGDHVAISAHVIDGDTIARMERGDARELSVGYVVDLDKTPGVHPVYGPFDATQKSIAVNHVALVEQARAGESARVRMDGRDVEVPLARWRDDESPVVGCPCCTGGAVACDDGCPCCATESAASGEGCSCACGVCQAGQCAMPRVDSRHGTCTSARSSYNHLQGTDHMADTSNIVETLTSQLAAATKRADEAAERADAATKRADETEGRLLAATERADKAEGGLEGARQELAKAGADRTDSADRVKTLTDQVTVLTGERDAQKARADQAESPKHLRTLIDARVRDESVAMRVLGDKPIKVGDADLRYDAMDDRTLLVEVIRKLQPDGAPITDETPMAYLRGRFDAAASSYTRCDANLQAVRDASTAAASAPRNDAKSAREAMIKRHQDASKTSTTDAAKGN
jgi:hypothetical protein